MSISTREINRGDREVWLRMRRLLWPESADEHGPEIDRWFAGKLEEPAAVILALDDNRAVGFAELSVRPYAEKCDTHNVAYLEGWFVSEPHRRDGVGRALIRAAKDWGRSEGCKEFASDASPDNKISIAAHLSCGFEDAGLVRCFRQQI